MLSILKNEVILSAICSILTKLSSAYKLDSDLAATSMNISSDLQPDSGFVKGEEKSLANVADLFGAPK